MVGNKPEDCFLVLYADASFAGDLKDSKSTSGCFLCIVGSHTFVPLNWISKKQTAVSHSSAEAEIIALEAALRMEGIPALIMWELITEIFSQRRVTSAVVPSSEPALGNHGSSAALDVDYVPFTLPKSKGLGKLILMEDNSSVITMITKGRSPTMRHVTRTHRVDLDWIFERLRHDPGIQIKYVGTKFQLADLLTKGSFTVGEWTNLCKMVRINLEPKVIQNEPSKSKKKPDPIHVQQDNVSSLIASAHQANLCFYSSLPFASFPRFVSRNVGSRHAVYLRGR